MPMSSPLRSVSEGGDDPTFLALKRAEYAALEAEIEELAREVNPDAPREGDPHG